MSTFAWIVVSFWLMTVLVTGIYSIYNYIKSKDHGKKRWQEKAG